MSSPTVSIIIRAKNEERWITSCLRAVYEQAYTDFEVILVNNESSDGTVRKAQQFHVKLITISDHRPGKVLNLGVRASSGKYLVFLSAHCIPVNNEWLSNLIAGFANERIAGVYGRQQPMTFSTPQAKRDLTITFGLDRRIQRKDPFFHNANSAIRRDLWESCPFDETVTNIEDRLWAEAMLARGYYILYEPQASVYHYHGIHHDNSEERMRTTVQVLERLYSGKDQYEPGLLDPHKLRIIAFVPVRGQSPDADGGPVLRCTLDATLESKYIHETLVLTDHPTTARYAEEYGASVPFLRDPEYSKDYVDLNTVYAYCLERLEDLGYLADLVVCLEPTYPLRPPGLIDDLIAQLLRGGYDSVLPARIEYNSCWIEEGDTRRRIDAGDIPRHLKDPVLIGLKGLGCVTHPEFLRQGRLLGDKVGLVRIDGPFAPLEVRSAQDIELLSMALRKNAIREV